MKKKKPRSKELITRGTIKIGNDLIELKRNRFICERHKPLFISWYLYRLKSLRKELLC